MLVKSTAAAGFLRDVLIVGHHNLAAYVVVGIIYFRCQCNCLHLRHHGPSLPTRAIFVVLMASGISIFLPIHRGGIIQLVSSWIQHCHQIYFYRPLLCLCHC